MYLNTSSMRLTGDLLGVIKPKLAYDSNARNYIDQFDVNTL